MADSTTAPARRLSVFGDAAKRLLADRALKLATLLVDPTIDVDCPFDPSEQITVELAALCALQLNGCIRSEYVLELAAKSAGMLELQRSDPDHDHLSSVRELADEVWQNIAKLASGRTVNDLAI